MNLDTLLHYFSILAFSIALVVVALACRRLRLGGGDKAFGVAAWIAFVDLAVYGLSYICDWIIALADYWWGSPTLASSAIPWINHGYQISNFLHLVFTLVFAAGCIRSARRLERKPAETSS